MVMVMEASFVMRSILHRVVKSAADLERSLQGRIGMMGMVESGQQMHLWGFKNSCKTEFRESTSRKWFDRLNWK